MFRLMVVSNLLEYCSQLGKHAEPYSSDAYFSDSEALKVRNFCLHLWLCCVFMCQTWDLQSIVTRRGGPTALPTVERRMDETRANSNMTLCTYAATEKGLYFASYACWVPVNAPDV